MNTWIRAAVTIGRAKTVRNATTSIIQTKTGIRIIVIPGARMFRIVTMKLTAAVIEPIPRSIRPIAQKSGPRPGRNPRASGVLVSGAYPNHPPSGAPPSTKLE